jgi:2-polyprenyl-6-methoxyphenol hydroxylase-like FAD-dependent oxidoreductase
MPTKGAPFLIAGGGIGGLAAALALARQGFPVRVLEQASDFREVGAGIQLGPNIIRAFEKLGIKDAVLADAWRPGAQEMRCALSGESVTRIPLGEEFIARFHEPYAVTHRHDLHAVLLDACRNNDLIYLDVSERVIDAVENEGLVEVALGGPDTGLRKTICGRALVGCDGVWSRVREKIVGDGAPRVSGHIAFRAVLPRAAVPDDLWEPDVVLWAGPRTHLVHYPLRRGTLYNLVAVFHSDRHIEGWNTEADPADLWAHFADQRPEVLRLLERIETWRMWALVDREPIK